MNRKLYLSLAKNNIRKNKSTFYPFAISAVTMIALFYMIYAIYVQVTESDGFYGMGSIEWVLQMGVRICGIFAAGVIFYTNSFLMKQRSKELGLYGILGMEKKHIAKVLFWEIAILGIICMLGGLGFGILFSRLMYLLLLKMLRIEAAVSFGISGAVIWHTVLVFGLVFTANIVRNTLMLKFIKPIDLLKSENYGEREPRAKWLQAILAIVFLGVGYWIAVTTDNPLSALNLFFVAVLLVMAGTYLLFMSGSVAILKLLKNNKGYYFHRTHFITVSGMMYRMKRNAVGLANICILSTAVLLIVSTTISLYAGIHDVVATMYPKDVVTTFGCPTELQRLEAAVEMGGEPEAAFDKEAAETVISDHAKTYGIQICNAYSQFSMFTIAEQTGENEFSDMEVFNTEKMILLNIITRPEREDMNGNGEFPELSEGEVWIWDSGEQIKDGDEIVFCGVKRHIRSLPQNYNGDEEIQKSMKQEYAMLGSSARIIMIVVPSVQEIEELADEINTAGRIAGRGNIEIRYEYMFNVKGEEEQMRGFCDSLRNCLDRAGIPRVQKVSNRFEGKESFEGMYASIFYIGLFIGTMFLLATVLIIYYKQISEGFEDRGRFEILQKVGMDQIEVKKVITTQILQVFFLPILLASVHIGFAFPIVRRILAIMGLMNVGLFVMCTLASILVFVIVYAIVYYLTAGVYYRLVYGKR